MCLLATAPACRSGRGGAAGVVDDQRVEVRVPTVRARHGHCGAHPRPVGHQCAELIDRHADLDGRLPGTAQTDRAADRAAIEGIHLDQAARTHKGESCACCTSVIEAGAVGGELTPRRRQPPRVRAPIDQAARVLRAQDSGRAADIVEGNRLIAGGRVGELESVGLGVLVTTGVGVLVATDVGALVAEGVPTAAPPPATAADALMRP